VAVGLLAGGGKMLKTLFNSKQVTKEFFSVFLFCLFFFLAMPASSNDILSAEERAWLNNHPDISLAPDPNFPPIEYFDDQGHYLGLVADYFKIIQSRLSCKFKFVHYKTWEDVLESARSHAISGITAAQITPERSEYLLYTKPIIDIPNVLIVRTGNQDELKLQNMQGMKVAVTNGNALHEYVRSKFPQIVILPVPDDLSALKEVSFSRADAAIVNLAIASYLCEKHGLSNLRVAGDSGKSNSLAIATRKDWPLLKRILEKGLASVTEEEREAIAKKWIGLLLPPPHFYQKPAFWNAVWIVGVLAIILVLTVLLWNHALRRQVALKTAELQQELAERKRAEEERGKLQEQLLHSQKMESIGRISGSVAHDINNLLTPIIGYSDLLLAKIPRKDDPVYQPLDIICKAGKRARDLTSQLLAFSRKQVMEMKELELKSLVANFEKMLFRVLRENVEFKVSSDGQTFFINGDSGQLEQILMNLVLNAQDAMPNGGSINISLSSVELPEEKSALPEGLAPGRYARLSVSDTGCGIKEECLSSIFEPFFTTKGKGLGTGLGLSTVYGIVCQHGGFINVRSKENEGSTFTIHLPQIADAVLDTERQDRGTHLQGEASILVVDDDNIVRELAVEMLKNKGYRVLSASSGSEALLLLERHKSEIDLLLSDVVMPGMNGRELYEKALEICPLLKAIFMSGYSKNILNNSTKNRPLHFINKPFTQDEIIAKIHEVLFPK